jgi:hypothetical protein
MEHLHLSVIPAKAGIQWLQELRDPRAGMTANWCFSTPSIAEKVTMRGSTLSHAFHTARTDAAISWPPTSPFSKFKQKPLQSECSGFPRPGASGHSVSESIGSLRYLAQLSSTETMIPSCRSPPISRTTSTRRIATNRGCGSSRRREITLGPA